jgi:type II secretory pathway pseudopilin PulG
MRRRRCRARGGFTILEILLVLAVLIVVISLTWPSLMRYMREQEIREGAELARTAAAGTRIKAIDTGLTYQFRYEPEGRKFVVVPLDPPDTIAASSTGTATDNEFTYPVVSGQVGIETRFVIPEDEPNVSEGLPPEVFAKMPNARDLEGVAWGPPVLFYPDGSADDAMFRVVNEDGLRIDLAIRGLTGTVTVGPIFEDASQ